MKISLLLHFYQPFNQQADILNRIVHECYLPVTRGLLENPTAKIIANISGSLTELLLNNGYEEVVNNFKTLLDRKQIEITSTAKYHPMLPLIPKDEIIRQIEQNNVINQRAYGDNYSPAGFFSPEMAVSTYSNKVIAKCGYTWLATPELALQNQKPDSNTLYQDRETGMKLLVRNKRVSSLILSAICRSAEALIKETQDIQNDKVWFCVMDAETFGHHRINHDKVLIDILTHPFFEPVLGSEILRNWKSIGMKSDVVDTRSCTWTNEEQDFWLDNEDSAHENKPNKDTFILWKDPVNPIHAKQWQLFDYVVSVVSRYCSSEGKKFNQSAQNLDNINDKKLQIRDQLDRAIGSDQFWWASAKPWWSLEMIEQGAYELKSVASKLPSDVIDKEKVEKLYNDILALAFEWQRTGYIRKRHLDASGTFMQKPFKDRAPSEWYNQIILEFEQEMKKAASTSDFEKAIKWRDALLKLKNGTDIYDVLHVVDELWTARNIPSVKPFLAHSWEEFSALAKDHFKDVTSKEEFEAWKLKRGF